VHGIGQQAERARQCRRTTAIRILLLTGTCIGGMSPLGSFARAETVNGSACGTNGTVSSIVVMSQTVFIGGTFSMAGVNTGGGVPVSPASGAVVSG